MIGVIGGSGFYDFFDHGAVSEVVDTPYGAPSAPVSIGRVGGHDVAFLPRHGRKHEFPPHRCLPGEPVGAACARGAAGVRAVRGGQPHARPRAGGGGDPRPVRRPHDRPHPDLLRRRRRPRQLRRPVLRELRAAAARQPDTIDGATMVVVEGPRFSTRAESRWYAAQGWQLVNMTGHPEAVLARELELCYAAIALVTDLDAGLQEGEGVRAVDVFAEFARNMAGFKQLVRGAIEAVDVADTCAQCRVHGVVSLDGVTLPIQLP